MSYLISLGLVETIFDPVVDRVKMVLVGATIIKRERVPIEVRNKLVVFDVDDGVDVDYCAGVGAAGAGAGTDNKKGLHLVDDVVAFSVRSVRNLIKV